MDSHAVFIHIHQGCFAGTGAIVRLPQCQWSKPDGYGKISQCITTTKHSKAKSVCIFLGIYCSSNLDIRKNNMNPLLASTSLKRQSVGVVLLIKLLRSMLYAHASKLQFGKKNNPFKRLYIQFKLLSNSNLIWKHAYSSYKWRWISYGIQKNMQPKAWHKKNNAFNDHFILLQGLCHSHPYSVTQIRWSMHR